MLMAYIACCYVLTPISWSNLMNLIDRKTKRTKCSKLFYYYWGWSGYGGSIQGPCLAAQHIFYEDETATKSSHGNRDDVEIGKEFVKSEKRVGG